jgi:hypothetical protein
LGFEIITDAFGSSNIAYIVHDICGNPFKMRDVPYVVALNDIFEKDGIQD